MIKLAVLCLCVATALTQDVDEVESQLQEINQKCKEFLKEGKFRELVDLHYAEDAKMITPMGRVIVGRDAILNEMNKKARMYQQLNDVEVQHEYVTVEGDLAVVIALMKAKVMRGDTEMDYHRRVVMVYRKIDDSYKAIIVGKSMGDGSHCMGMHGRGSRTKRETAQEAIPRIYESIQSLTTEGKLEEGLTKFVALDARAVSPSGKLIQGREELATELKKKMKECKIKTVSTNIDSLIEEGSWVVEIGVTDVTCERNGVEMEKKQRHLTVWKKTTDGYVQIIRMGFKGIGDRRMGHRHRHGGKRRHRRYDPDAEKDTSEEGDEDDED